MPRRVKGHNYDAKLEGILQEGCNILAGQEKPNITAVTKQLSAAHGLHIPYDTLRRRFLKLCQSRRHAHGKQQLMSPAQETVLVDWIKHLSSLGHPISKRTIRKKACDLCGCKPSKNWIPRFLG